METCCAWHMHGPTLRLIKQKLSWVGVGEKERQEQKLLKNSQMQRSRRRWFFAERERSGSLGNTRQGPRLSSKSKRVGKPGRLKVWLFSSKSVGNVAGVQEATTCQIFIQSLSCDLFYHKMSAFAPNFSGQRSTNKDKELSNVVEVSLQSISRHMQDDYPTFVY